MAALDGGKYYHTEVNGDSQVQHHAFDSILVLYFGSQTSESIRGRLREFHTFSEPFSYIQELSKLS